MPPNPTSGPCTYTASRVDAMLEDRDHIWCLALLSTVPSLGTVTIESILRRYHELRANEIEALSSLKRT